MGKKQPKTEGLEWLIYSLGAFNGSGYANMDSAEDFLDSYITYKVMRKRPEAARLAKECRQDVLPWLEDMLARTTGAGRTPAQKYMAKFQSFKNQTGLF